MHKADLALVVGYVGMSAAMVLGMSHLDSKKPTKTLTNVVIQDVERTYIPTYGFNSIHSFDDVLLTEIDQPVRFSTSMLNRMGLSPGMEFSSITFRKTMDPDYVGAYYPTEFTLK